MMMVFILPNQDIYASNFENGPDKYERSLKREQKGQEKSTDHLQSKMDSADAAITSSSRIVINKGVIDVGFAQQPSVNR